MLVGVMISRKSFDMSDWCSFRHIADTWTEVDHETHNYRDVQWKILGNSRCESEVGE